MSIFWRLQMRDKHVVTLPMTLEEAEPVTQTPHLGCLRSCPVPSPQAEGSLLEAGTQLHLNSCCYSRPMEAHGPNMRSGRAGTLDGQQEPGCVEQSWYPAASCLAPITEVWSCGRERTAPLLQEAISGKKISQALFFLDLLISEEVKRSSPTRRNDTGS